MFYLVYVMVFKFYWKSLKISFPFANNNRAINNIKPPIFFKDKPLISIQSKLWNLAKINLILKRLSDTEIKCESGLFLDKLLGAQLILSTSVMAKNAIKP